ncbi:MAG: hypothetical protein ACYTF1_12780 [Planctomycetota bacterium]|jgi:hypothetical protein
MPAVSDLPYRRARKWRKLTILVGLLLAANCFLPAITACNAPVIPAMHGFESFHDGPDNSGNKIYDLLGFVSHLFCYYPAYLFGLLMAVGAWARLTKRKRLSLLCVLSIVGLMIVMAVILLVYGIVAWIYHGDGPSSWSDWPILLGFYIAPAITLIYLLLVYLFAGCRYLCDIFILNTMILLWFGCWFIVAFDDALYGLYLSFSATLLLLIACIGEAKTLSSQTWRKTLFQLLTCRLIKVFETPGHCPICDYYLYGLTKTRCPECGRPFTFQEVGVSPQELGFTGTIDTNHA